MEVKQGVVSTRAVLPQHRRQHKQQCVQHRQAPPAGCHQGQPQELRHDEQHRTQTGSQL